jgi:hypothetical protein
MMQNHWTPERGEELRRHVAAGLSASKVAVPLQTTRGAILGRSNRMRVSLGFWIPEREEKPRRQPGGLMPVFGLNICSTTRTHPPIASAFESRRTSASRDDRFVRVSKASSIKAEPNVRAVSIVRGGSFHEADLRQCHL